MRDVRAGQCKQRATDKVQMKLRGSEKNFDEILLQNKNMLDKPKKQW